MQWSEAINEYIHALVPIKLDATVAEKIYRMLDLTSLNEMDIDERIMALCAKAQTKLGHVAALCVYPQFISTVKSEIMNAPIKIATVVNFPEGELPLDHVLIQINQALEAGANEIDVVFPYHRYLAGERQYAHHFVSTCKAACGQHVLLKVILETGALNEVTIIADASYEALAAGADFIKTSTGKIAEGATLPAVATMLLVMKHIQSKLHHSIGIKVSGGIRELQQAVQYVELANRIMGDGWASPHTFRIGASKLVDELLTY